MVMRACSAHTGKARKRASSTRSSPVLKIRGVGG